MIFKKYPIITDNGNKRRINGYNTSNVDIARCCIIERILSHVCITDTYTLSLCPSSALIHNARAQYILFSILRLSQSNSRIERVSPHLSFFPCLSPSPGIELNPTWKSSSSSFDVAILSFEIARAN